MSAMDVAGAVVWTPLAILFWAGVVRCNEKRDTDAVRVGIPLAILVSLAAVYCIARVCGAHA